MVTSRAAGSGSAATAAQSKPKGSRALPIVTQLNRVERRQWWLWASVVGVTLLLTLGIFSFTLPFLFGQAAPFFLANLKQSVHGLIGMVLLFDIYAIYQQVQIQRVRKRLMDSEALFHLIGENAADLIAVVGPDGKRLYNSPSYERVLGYAPHELEKASGLDQVHPEDLPLVIEAAEETKRTGTGSRLEYRFLHKNGTWRYLESTSSAVRNARGETERLIIVNRDITDRKQAEEQLRHKEAQLRQAQKMEAVGRLSGGIAHDFNNLLSVIIGYADELETSSQENDKLRKSAEQIRKAGERAASLTRQLLAFSRQQVLQPRVLDLNNVVTDLAKMLRRLIGADVELALALDPQTERVKADHGQIEQVIMNLVVNARDAMPDGGKLAITTSNVELTAKQAETIPYLQAGTYVQLTVTDTGIGMSAETMAHIFEPFFTTKDRGKGTGLGLATVYGIIKQSGGFIWVASEPGKGASFRILLPRTTEPLTTESPKLQPQAQAAVKRTVLVVEDEDSLRALISGLLAKNGYKVLTASAGPEALEIAQKAGGSIHLLLTDVVLPGMSGPSLATTLGSRFPEMRILYMSGYSEFESEGRGGGLPAGASLLQKPFTKDILLHRVNEVFSLTPMPAH
jgi:PAS domain S-box-containing protein